MPSGDFIFSGSTKEIIVVSGVTEVDVQDMYSRWKDWVITDDNSKYQQALRTFGGDPTIAGQFAPRYFFLTNLWRVIVDNGEHVEVGINLYTNELVSPFIVGSGSSVTNQVSDAVVTDDGISETLDYAGRVEVNSLVGVAGTTYPIGTAAIPVDNMTDALIIASGRSLHEIHIFGTIDFNVELHDFEIHGGNIRDVVNFQNINTSGCTYRECVLDGRYIGHIAADTCQISDGLSGMEGVFRDCGIQGIMDFDDGVTTSLINCSSMVPGKSSPSMFLGTDIDLNLRTYSGGMAVYDCGSGTTATLEYLAGSCNILSGNTGGTLEVRGLAKFFDGSSGTTIGTDGLLIPISVAQQHSLNVNTEITKNK